MLDFKVLFIAPDNDFDKFSIYRLYFYRIGYANFYLGKTRTNNNLQQGIPDLSFGYPVMN